MDDQPSQSALEIWQERLEYFQKELAITANPTMKFELRKQIEECQQKIKELAAVTSQESLKSYFHFSIVKVFSPWDLDDKQ